MAEKELKQELLDQTITIYDLNQYIRDLSENIEESFWFRDIAILTARNGNGCYADYEAIGGMFSSVNDKLSVEVVPYDPKDENVIWLRPEGERKVTYKEIIDNAPHKEMKGSEFFRKHNYNDRCIENFDNLVDYLDKIGYFTVNLDASLKENKLEESSNNLILYKIYDYNKDWKSLTCDINLVKKYLEEHIGNKISIYQNSFKLVNNYTTKNIYKKGLEKSNFVVTDKLYDFPDVGHQIKNQIISNENIKSIINKLEVSHDSSLETLLYFDVKVMDTMWKHYVPGMFSYAGTAPFKSGIIKTSDKLRENIVLSKDSDELDEIKKYIRYHFGTTDMGGKEDAIKSFKDLSESLKESKLEEDKSDDIKDFINDLYELRKQSIEQEGEYGLGNLVFKEFRNKGYLDNLKDQRKIEKGKELSLEELTEEAQKFNKTKKLDKKSFETWLEKNKEKINFDETEYGYKLFDNDNNHVGTYLKGFGEVWYNDDSLFEELLKEEFDKFLSDYDNEMISKYRYYANLDDEQEITEENLDKNALNYVSAYENCDVNELKEILLRR